MTLRIFLVLANLAFFAFQPLMYLITSARISCHSWYDVTVHVRYALTGSLSILHRNVEGFGMVKSRQRLLNAGDGTEKIRDLLMAQVAQSRLDP